MLAQLERADALSILNTFLERIKKSHGDIITTRHYDIMLQICAKAKPASKAALQTALDVYAFLDTNAKGSFEATDSTYSHLMNTIGKQLPKTDNRRKELLVRIFQKAANEGLVSYFVWNALRRSLPYKAHFDVLRLAVSKDGKLSYDNVPKEWKRRL